MSKICLVCLSETVLIMIPLLIVTVMILGFITLQRFKTFQIQCKSCGLCIYFKPFLPQLLFTPFITHCLNVKKKKSIKKTTKRNDAKRKF